MVLKIYRAADAFLYLPTYIAEEEGIFETLLKPFGITDIQFYPKPDQDNKGRGDYTAIKEMFDENNNPQNSIAIAICDPTALLSQTIADNIKNDIRVIGAIINKLPFWAVNHINRKFDKIDAEFGRSFNKVIHYQPDLTTGYYLGNKVKLDAKIANAEYVSFGEEIPKLLENYKSDNGNSSHSVAITADILTLAKEITKPSEPLIINYSFSNQGEFLTTGILTSSSCCVQHPEVLSKIIEGIQKSILILYSSEKIARKISIELLKRPMFQKVSLNDKEIEAIFKLINDEKFYPADLNITKKSWNDAIFSLSKTQHWTVEVETEILKNSFEELVDNSFVVDSEKSLARQFGINIKTFEDEFIAELKARISNVFKKFILSRAYYTLVALSILAIIAYIFYLYYDYEVTQKKLTLKEFIVDSLKEIMLAIIPLVIGIVGLFLRRIFQSSK